MLIWCACACSSPATNAGEAAVSPSPLTKQPAPAAVASQTAPARAATGTVAAAAPTAAPPAAATPSGPRIYSVRTTPTVVHGGDSVVWDVHTTPDVVKVVARTSLYALTLNRVAPGHFVLSFAIPSGVPSFFHGNYNLDVAAGTSSGDTAHRQVSLSFQ
jgi:hypothetical protein